MPPLVSNAFWEPLNVALFLRMHATAASPHALIAVAAVLAELPLLAAFAIAGWNLFSRSDRVGISLAIATTGIVMLIEALIDTFAFHPRPFAAGFGQAWITHAANNSMPSTHVALALALAAVQAMRKQYRSSMSIFALATAMAWARVYVGIHWPADMVGAALSATLAAALVHVVEKASDSPSRS